MLVIVIGCRRPIAINATPLTPMETARGTESLDADSGAIAYKNAVVKKGSDDRHFVAAAAQADIPYGVLLNDQVDSGEEGVIKKSIAIFGLYPESLPCVSDGSGTIAAGAQVVVSAAGGAAAGKVKTLPAGAGTYFIIGRSRFAVAATDGDPVSLIHCCAEKFIIP
jgi:hypothetical protein